MTSTPQFSIGKLSNVISVNETNKRIGIGTASAQSQLHLHSYNANADVRMQFTDNITGADDNTKGFRIGKNTDGNGFISINEAKDLIFSTNTSERMRILSNGNIGIGTNDPTYLLDVNSTSFRVATRTANNNITGGLGVTWNNTNTVGETNFWNYKGLYAGGFYFRTRTTTDAADTAYASITCGSITTNNANINAGTGTVTAGTFSGALAWANITGVPSLFRTFTYTANRNDDIGSGTLRAGFDFGTYFGSGNYLIFFFQKDNTSIFRVDYNCLVFIKYVSQASYSSKVLYTTGVNVNFDIYNAGSYLAFNTYCYNSGGTGQKGVYCIIPFPSD